MYQKYQLKNKATLFLVPLNDTKSITTLVMYPVGSRYESEKMSGVSHFIEHMMFKGTKKRPNTLTLTREIDRLGAEYNAFTGKEYTGYYIKADAKYLSTSLDILSDMLFNSKFDEREIQKEKGVIVEEIRMYNDNPLMNIGNIFEEVLFVGELSRDIAGTEKHVLSYKRKDILDYRDKYYSPNNMTIVLAGNIDEKTKGLVEKYFGIIKNNKKLNKNFVSGKFAESKKIKIIKIQNKKTDQAQMMLGFPGFAYNAKENSILTVLNTILGGSMSSRLFIQIRERRGLAYMVRSGAVNFRDIGYIYIRAGLEVKNINKAIEVIKTEIKKIIKNGVSKKELADAKTHIRGSLTLSLEDSSAQANWIAKEALFMDEIKVPEDRLLEIEKVTNEEIKNLAKKVFKFDQMRVAIIGDVEEKNIKF